MQAPQTRRPGEAVFATAVAVTSLYLLYSAYGISGFTALSAPGAIPMATTCAMSVTAIIVLYRTLRTPADPEGRFLRDVLPRNIIVVALMLVAYAFALKPLGFLPTSALFLIGAIKLLSARSWVFSVSIGLFTLLCIYLVFRIVFTVLMPAGIVPEGEMLAVIKSIFGGGK